MMDTLDVKLLKRSIGQKKIHRSIKPLYSDKIWVEDLDIINELGGHTGCVNALSWSAGGNLLASGSDDTYLNIWEYNPANLAKPFTLNTSVNTGHTANIFSVKFMPHSNDRTVVTCAGDSEVRVFDLEYGGSASNDNEFSTSTRTRRFNNFFGSARWLNEGNTNARVYRSHADRAKRIVTESSPHLFLSCSEDGEVRQWDLRQPSSAYPSPHEGRRNRTRGLFNDDGPTNVPPPLISYKKYRLDLNSISCSGSQPYYIALGGAHLHCFLHDRRMLGRDISNEYGRPAGFTPVAGSTADEGMREATKCVRRFAPNNRRNMNAHETGHITACKISDARPNELVSSWSGDYIYSFDIVKSPDARDEERRQDRASKKVRLRNPADHKRKRATERPENAALRVRYETGETEDVDIAGPGDGAEPAHVHDTLLTEAQRVSEGIARSLVQLRATMFGFSASLSQDQIASMESSSELTPFTNVFTRALGQAASLLPQMEESMRNWSYPVNPTDDEVTYQNTLRRNRQASWRFVQAAGCLSKLLGGKLQTLSSAPDPRLAQFSVIKPAFREGSAISSTTRFCYDFLKAILLWLDGGQDALLDGFKKASNARDETPRYPLSQHDTVDSMIDKLSNYLIRIANDEKPIIDLGSNRFERDEVRNVFDSQQAAVEAFVRAASSIELRENQGTSEISTDTSRPGTRRVMDKGAAVRFWALKVGRSLLLAAAEDVTFSFTRHAFGGTCIQRISDAENLGHAPHTLSEDGEDRIVEEINVVMPNPSTTVDNETAQHPHTPAPNSHIMISEPTSTATVGSTQRSVSQTPSANEETTTNENLTVHGEEYDDDEDEDENLHEDEPERETSDDDDDDDGATHPLFRRRIGIGRVRARNAVNQDVAYTSHTRVYKGHCNARTVKDVNYYGLDDEYVVSGSDDGNFFIWDRKTGQVLNILEGDGEIVNVVQGHPYEPMIACSGIDSTVKIFAPGRNNRERRDAIRGINIANPGGGGHSTLHFDRDTRRNRTDNEDDTSTPHQDQAENDHDNDEEPALARNGLRSRRAMARLYEITSQNDAMRRQGPGETFVTEGMLARLAALLQQGGGLHGIPVESLVGEGGTIVVDQDNCSVM